MCDDRASAPIIRHFKGCFLGKLKNTFLSRKRSHKPHLFYAERLEARILLSGTPLGAAHTLVADAEVADTLDVSGLWQPMDELHLANEKIVSSLSLKANKSFSLDHDLLGNHLAATPVEFSGELGNVIWLPSPSGVWDQFTIWESAIMAPDLAAKFPAIETFSGCGIDDPTASVRSDLIPQGFHAQVLSSHGTYYNDPFSHIEAT